MESDIKKKIERKPTMGMGHENESPRKKKKRSPTRDSSPSKKQRIQKKKSDTEAINPDSPEVRARTLPEGLDYQINKRLSSSPKRNVRFAEQVNVFVYEMDGGKDPST